VSRNDEPEREWEGYEVPLGEQTILCEIVRCLSPRGKEMSYQHYTDHRVLEVIARSPGILLDQIVLECSDITWNQVFLVLDHFSREGVLTMSPEGLGQYAITFRLPMTPSSRQRGKRVEARESI
jgi:hypothetical protein